MIPKIVIHSLKSLQGVVLKKPAKAQAHFIETLEEDKFFVLVVDSDGDVCQVIPGCFDPLEAGPDDIFLPEDVLGEPVMLSIGCLCTIPRSMIGDGFATLYKDPYNKIIEAMIKYDEGDSDIGFDRGYKYLSKYDSRLKTRRRMLEGLIAAQQHILTNN